MSSDKDIAFPMTAVNSFVTNPINDPSKKTASFLPKAFSSKNTVIGERKETPLEELNKFVKEIQEADSNHEEIANKYLELFDRESRFIIKTKDVKKYLPNFNHKSEKKLLQLFGVTPTNAMNPKNPKEILYFFSPYQYILTTMVHAVSYATFEDRIDFAFQMYDSDSDGRISKADLKDMFTLYGKENAFRIDNQNLDSIVNVIFKSMGQNESGLISLTDFRAFFSNDRAKSIKINVFERRKAKTHFSKIEVGSPTRKAPRQSGILVSIGNWFSDLFNLMQKSVNKIVWMTIWGAGLLYFFISTFIMFYDKLGIPAGFAKGCAASIDYNIAFMLVLATKSLTTIIRTIGLGKILPVNINIYLHTRIGFVTFGASWIHTLMHLIFILPTLSEMGPLVAKYTNVTEQEPYLWWVFASLPGWTGILSIIIMTILPIFAIKKLRNANYERFWYTHYLWLPLFILVSVHGQKRYLGDPKFYLYGGIPAIILVLEKIGMAVDFFRKPFKVLDMTYLDSEVIELKVNRPAGFKYIPGQYCRIKVPRLSNFQWHPFSISSSPDDDFVSFHISPVGDWTNQVKQLALDYKAQKLSKTPSIFVMGPYGAPSQHYNDFSHLMIISSGIGATPFASIMRHINEQVKKDPESQSHARTVSVDFYWVNKKPSSHIWLASLFKEIQANEAVKGLIKINMFFTSPHEKYDLRSILLWKGLEILYAEGIKVKGLEHFDLMRWGRPEWSEIFQKKAEDVGSGQVGVFFCGNTMLAKELHDNCVKHSGAVQFRFRKEIF